MEETVKKLKKLTSSVLIVGGDFNGKVGKRIDDQELCIGRWSRGTRNDNGQKLIDFCTNNNLCISNTVFQHPAKHTSTWSREVKDRTTNSSKWIYSQIDYILVGRTQSQLMVDARSVNGMMTNSDHRIVITRLLIAWSKAYKSKLTTNTVNMKYNTHKLIHDTNTKIKYQEYLNEQSTNLNICTTTKIKEIIHDAAEKCLGKCEPRKNKVITNNKEIQDLSKKQKNLRIKIENTRNTNKKEKLKKLRKKTLQLIKEKLKIEKDKQIDRMLREVDEAKDEKMTRKCFKQ